ncbi:ethylbenzene dehydrogenase-related protein [Malonomonas rubra]|uniref:ethylbenzene dehydrogenase-related protein n=1 Tax=Malonomonas rubra TaxID=57040 RepID=UPI0026EEDCCF|nr:ethylbenzene dehydrogenase-related protein [Malonomonas rubra]
MLRISLILLLLLALSACNEVPSEKVVSLKLQHPPSDADWQRAAVHRISVVGGRPHKEILFPDIDQDMVHTSTASCHHGAALPEPITVEVRSFYTDSQLYLQLKWPDATADRQIRQWRYNGESWQTSNAMEDGFGILWPGKRKPEKFSCARACHLDDFGVQGARFHAQNRMKLAGTDTRFDLWNWRAERTGRFGFADDRYLDQEGMHGDLPGELFRENSRAVLQENGLKAFADGDQPVYDQEGEPFAGRFIPAGSTAPGYLTELPSGDRADISAHSEHVDGHWVVTLRRALQTGSPRDVQFSSGQEFAFGLSVMDNTLYDHYASKYEESLLLVAEDD